MEELTNDQIRLKLQQISDDQAEATNHLAQLEERLDALGDSVPGRALARLDGIEATLIALQGSLEATAELQAKFIHRHTDPLPNDGYADVTSFPPGCPEQCWKTCECAKLKGDRE